MTWIYTLLQYGVITSDVHQKSLQDNAAWIAITVK